MSIRRLSMLMVMSGCSALMLEMVWLRRLSLHLGSAGLSATVTLAIYMGGLGMGAWLSGKVQWSSPLKAYGSMEAFVGVWAVLFPYLITVLSPVFMGDSWIALLLSVPLLLPPALAHGATLPALSQIHEDSQNTGMLYAFNTFGAVSGVLIAAFVMMPMLGVRGTELVAMALCMLIAIVSLVFQSNKQSDNANTYGVSLATIPNVILLQVAAVGLVSMSLEIVWSRLAALLIGGSVYAFAVVLSVFLTSIAIGAHFGKSVPKQRLSDVIVAMGVLTLLGAYSWRWLPHGLALGWDWFGGGSLLPVGAVLLAFAMAGAPVASGAVFSLALKQGKGGMAGISSKVLVANTIGGVLGVLLTGPVFMPKFGIVQSTVGMSLVCILTGMFTWKNPSKQLWMSGLTVILLYGLPKWDVAVYATGLYNRIGEFVDLSPRAIEQFAHEGWEPQFYVDGHSASVAVGQSTRTKNLWLSINGKVDASTGDDMPTQILSGQLPVSIHAKSKDVATLVVGLASGVTANEARLAGANPLTVVELEPHIVAAAKYFERVNDAIVDNPQTMIRVADARAVLQHEDTLYDVIISEPSNPWITGVSNLFTVEYWRLGRKRLKSDGVFCQWVQLYALPPEGMRSLIASYIEVFPNTWLFETIPGSDALLISAPNIPMDLALEPTLGPDDLKLLTEGVRLNTDDKPWIEFEAPKWINRPTGKMNRELIESIVEARKEP